jgi:hypothetical protein
MPAILRRSARRVSRSGTLFWVAPPKIELTVVYLVEDRRLSQHPSLVAFTYISRQARVALARAVYSSSRTLLLDDVRNSIRPCSHAHIVADPGRFGKLCMPQMLLYLTCSGCAHVRVDCQEVPAGRPAQGPYHLARRKSHHVLARFRFT